MPPTKSSFTPAREDDLYAEHDRYIKEHFGPRAANTANYGWAVDELTGYISTKVYGHGVLTSHISCPSDFEFEPYSR